MTSRSQGGGIVPTPLDRLDCLFFDLRADGFRIGIGEQIRVHTLLLALTERGELPHTAAELARWIGPIVCTNPRQQELFTQRVTTWAERERLKQETIARAQGEGHATPATVPTATPNTAPTEQLSRLADDFGKPQRPRWVWALALLAVLTLVAAVLFGMPDTIPDAVPELTDPIVQHRPPVADPLPLPKPASAVGTSWLAAQIKAVLAAVQAQQNRLLVVALPLLALLAAWLRRRERQAVLERDLSARPPQRRRFRLAGVSSHLFSGTVLTDTMRRMRLHRPVPSTRIDVIASLRATARAGGLPMLRYRTRPQTPEYLVLVDRLTLADHQATVGDLMVERLRDEDVFVQTYDFFGDPRLCAPHRHAIGDPDADHDGQSVPLADLTARHAGQALLIFSDGAGLIGPLSGMMEDWVAGLHATFDSVVLFTPRPADAWGNRERRLQAGGIVVLPADPDGIALFIDRYVCDSLAPGVAEKLPLATASATPRLPARLRDDPEHWLAGRMPREEEVAALLADTRTFLGPDGFTLLCATAAFPRITPHLTLFLGSRLLDHAGAPLLTERRLAQLGRLVWLRYGRMPDWLRVALLHQLAPKRRAEINRLLHEFLTQAGAEHGAGVNLEVAERDPQDLRARLRHKVRTAPETAPLRDYIFLSFIRGRVPELAVAAPNTLASRFKLPDDPWPYYAGLITACGMVGLWVVYPSLALLSALVWEGINLLGTYAESYALWIHRCSAVSTIAAAAYWFAAGWGRKRPPPTRSRPLFAAGAIAVTSWLPLSLAGPEWAQFATQSLAAGIGLLLLALPREPVRLPEAVIDRLFQTNRPLVTGLWLLLALLTYTTLSIVFLGGSEHSIASWRPGSGSIILHILMSLLVLLLAYAILRVEASALSAATVHTAGGVALIVSLCLGVLDWSHYDVALISNYVTGIASTVVAILLTIAIARSQHTDEYHRLCATALLLTCSILAFILTFAADLKGLLGAALGGAPWIFTSIIFSLFMAKWRLIGGSKAFIVSSLFVIIGMALLIYFAEIVFSTKNLLIEFEFLVREFGLQSRTYVREVAVSLLVSLYICSVITWLWYLVWAKWHNTEIPLYGMTVMAFLTIHWSIPQPLGITLSLLSIIIPMAAWLGHRHGEQGVRCVAIVCALSIFTIGFPDAAPLGFTGNLGLCLASLLAASLAARREWLRQTLAANTISWRSWLLSGLFLSQLVTVHSGRDLMFSLNGDLSWCFWLVVVLIAASNVRQWQLGVLLVGGCVVGSAWQLSAAGHPASGELATWAIGDRVILGLGPHLGGPATIVTALMALWLGRRLRAALIDPSHRFPFFNNAVALVAGGSLLIPWITGFTLPIGGIERPVVDDIAIYGSAFGLALVFQAFRNSIAWGPPCALVVVLAAGLAYGVALVPIIGKLPIVLAYGVFGWRMSAILRARPGLLVPAGGPGAERVELPFLRFKYMDLVWSAVGAALLVAGIVRTAWP